MGGSKWWLLGEWQVQLGHFQHFLDRFHDCQFRDLEQLPNKVKMSASKLWAVGAIRTDKKAQRAYHLSFSLSEAWRQEGSPGEKEVTSRGYWTRRPTKTRSRSAGRGAARV